MVQFHLNASFFMCIFDLCISRSQSECQEFQRAAKVLRKNGFLYFEFWSEATAVGSRKQMMRLKLTVLLIHLYEVHVSSADNLLMLEMQQDRFNTWERVKETS